MEAASTRIAATAKCRPWRTSGPRQVLPGSFDGRLQAECAGDALRLSINGKPMGQARDASFSRGVSGLMMAGEKSGRHQRRLRRVRAGTVAVTGRAAGHAMCFAARAVRRRHGLEISLTVSMTKHFDDIGAMVGRQIQQHALAPEALAQFADQAG